MAKIQTLRKLSPHSLFQIYPSGYNKMRNFVVALVNATYITPTRFEFCKDRKRIKTSEWWEDKIIIGLIVSDLQTFW